MTVSIEQGLQAHFFQCDGTSRPGTEWSVAIDDARVLVRAYADNTAGLTTADEAAAVIAFVESNLATGWRPTDAAEPLILSRPARPAPIVASLRYWFPAKRYGWGWGFPSTWEGWMVMAIWIGILIVSSIVVLPHHPFARSGVVFVAVASLIGICFAKGEPPRWRWGG